MSASDLTFSILALTSIGAAVGMLTARNVVHSVFWLAVSMLAVGGLLLLLAAEYLAVAHVLLFAGAVPLLLLVAILPLVTRREQAVRPVEISIGAAVLSTLFGVVIYAAIARSGHLIAEGRGEAGDTSVLGEMIFTRWILPVELTALVLLVAIVGALWWATGDDR